MKGAEKLITDNLDVWSSAVQVKSSAGRGNSKKLELYGIKKLRELILGLAVRGLLVPQDPKDEPASTLLKKVAAIKLQLVKGGKIKKPKKLPSIAKDEKPFVLPKGWEWIRLQNISEYIQRGKGPKYSDFGELRVVSQKCIQWNGFEVELARYVDDSSLDKYQEERFLKDNDLLWNSTGTGTVGRINLLAGIEPKSLVADSHVTVIRTLLEDAGFICNYISSAEIQKRIDPSSDNPLVSGTTNQVELNTSAVIGLPVPVPPVSEQHRIVAKVEELMALCDQLEQQQESSITAHQTLVKTFLDTLTTASKRDGFSAAWSRIAEHFDTLFTTEWSIDKLKQTVLQLAVMGKLIPQDSNDEPARLLLENLEKARDNWLQESSSDNAESRAMMRKLAKLDQPTDAFPLPASWTSAHLIQISQLMVDCHNKTAPYVDSGIPIIRTTNIRDREYIKKDQRFVDQEIYDYWSRRCPPEPGDIIFTREAPMGEALIIPEGVKWCLGQRTMLIRPLHEFIYNEYLLLALTEPHLLERASEHAVGLTVKHLRVGDVENLNLPIPPLAEQYRIVDKFYELMGVCDALKNELEVTRNKQFQLADSIGNQATSRAHI